MATRSLGTTLTLLKTTAPDVRLSDDLEVGGLTSIGGIELTADTLDATTLNNTDGYRTFIGGFADGGDISVEGYLSNDGADEKVITELVGTSSLGGEIEFSNGAKWTFTGLVTGFSTNADLEDPLSFTITIKVTGKPTFAGG